MLFICTEHWAHWLIRAGSCWRLCIHVALELRGWTLLLFALSLHAVLGVDVWVTIQLLGIPSRLHSKGTSRWACICVVCVAICGTTHCIHHTCTALTGIPCTANLQHQRWGREGIDTERSQCQKNPAPKKSRSAHVASVCTTQNQIHAPASVQAPCC